MLHARHLVGVPIVATATSCANSIFAYFHNFCASSRQPDADIYSKTAIAWSLSIALTVTLI